MKFSILIRSFMVSLGISGCVFAVPPRTQAPQRPLPLFAARTQQQALAYEAAARARQTIAQNLFRQAATTAQAMATSLFSRVADRINETVNMNTTSDSQVTAENRDKNAFDLTAYAKKFTLDEIVPEVLRSNWLTWAACYPYLLWRKGPRETAKIALINGITYFASYATGRNHLIEKPWLLQTATSFALNHYLHTYVVDPFVDGIADAHKNQGAVS